MLIFSVDEKRGGTSEITSVKWKFSHMSHGKMTSTSSQLDDTPHNHMRVASEQQLWIAFITSALRFVKREAYHSPYSITRVIK